MALSSLQKTAVISWIIEMIPIGVYQMPNYGVKFPDIARKTFLHEA
jgi:hypothetical protein